MSESKAVMETLCTRCEHRSVCKWTEKFIVLTNRLNSEDLSKTPFGIVTTCSYSSRRKDVCRKGE